MRNLSEVVDICGDLPKYLNKGIRKAIQEEQQRAIVSLVLDRIADGEKSIMWQVQFGIDSNRGSNCVTVLQQAQ